MAHPYWPFFDLRVRTPRVELRPACSVEDVTALAARAAAGIHPPDFMSRASRCCERSQSIGVTRSLGYAENGDDVALRRGEAGRQVRFVMDRALWESRA